jgi:uncharacterized phage infection (PIP) family protein YhgE
LSTLTKTLIVLLTLSSFCLCGAVVTYVGMAENYKEKHQNEARQSQDAITKQRHAEATLKEKTEEFQTKQDQLSKQVAQLQTKLEAAQQELRTVNTKRTSLEEQVQSLASMYEALEKSKIDQQGMLDRTLGQLEQTRSKQIRQEKELAETVRELMAKSAIIETLERDKKRLEEQLAQVQKQLDQVWVRVGKEAAVMVPVTPETGVARPAPPVVKEVRLQGVVTALDLKNELAQISIGSAHGVKENMRFFVTRGDQFVCEIGIFDVDSEKAIGEIRNVNFPPQVGDTVATNL